jgi:hypothetical protein
MSDEDESDCPFCDKPSADGHSHTYIEMNSEEFKGYVEAATERDQLRAALRSVQEMAARWQAQACQLRVTDPARVGVLSCVAELNGALALLEAKAGGR